MQILKQGWWVPFAGVLALAQLWVGLAFFYGDGTSDLLDAESTAAGASLALGGAGALATGVCVRTQARWVGNTLIIVGAALGGIWVWTVVMTPLANVVIVGSSSARCVQPLQRSRHRRSRRGVGWDVRPLGDSDLRKRHLAQRLSGSRQLLRRLRPAKCA